MQFLVLAVLAVLAAAIAVIALAAARVGVAADRLRARLLSETGQDAPGAPPTLMVEAARRAGADGGWRAARLVQQGELRRDPREPWRPMPATQVIALGTPGFVWDARQPGPVLPMVRVLDSFVAGQGALAAYLLGAFPVARAEGAETTRAEAMRYLAELPWAPDAILSNPALRWSVVSGNEVEVRLPLDPRPAVLRLHLDAAGDVVEIHGRDRPATEPDGRVVLRDWIGKFSDHQTIGGRRIPTRGEVGYVYDFGYAPYWRGRITGYSLEGRTAAGDGTVPR